MGGVAGVSTTAVWGKVENHDMVRGLPRLTLVSGKIYVYMYIWDFDIKILYVLCFQRVYGL